MAVVNLIYRPSMLRLKEETLERAPEKKEAFDYLEKLITTQPETGIPDMCLLENGKSVKCYKQTTKLFLF